MGTRDAIPRRRRRTPAHGATGHPSHRIRIIGGRHRGRVIAVPDVPGLRPTPDRVRETLFNWLGQDLTGASTLEPYAGTGVLSLEAQSRGAARSVAVDRNAALVRELQRAAALLALPALETHIDDALRFLAKETRAFDVVFLDPPFADDPWRDLFAALPARLSRNGRVYAEAARLLDAPPGFERLRHGRAGGVHYHLFAQREQAAPAPR
jgi:16S rRNA (guanine(966)-N(2))-methyltransferase RsmD